MVQVSIDKKNFAVVLKGVQELDKRVLDAGEQALSAGLKYAVGASMKDYLLGPRPQRLGTASTRLYNSIDSDVRRTDTGVAGRIGSNVVYAKFHEFGFQGVIMVRGHTRVMGVVGKAGKVTSGFQIERDNRGYVARRKDRRPEAVKLGLSGYGSIQIVKAHKRKVDYAGRPFIRPALAKALPMIREELLTALNKPAPDAPS